MGFANHNEITKNINNGLAILQIIHAREEQVRDGKTTEQKDVFEYMENKYFNQEYITRGTTNA